MSSYIPKMTEYTCGINSEESYWVEKATEILDQLSADDWLPVNHEKKLSPIARVGLVDRLNSYNAMINEIRLGVSTSFVQDDYTEPDPEVFFVYSEGEDD